ncbi:MAG TPA: adenylate/guanylate cyclase domain-containing protein, partial [Candidatus Cloacimonadota bacterium]|nr:adenylate/guanylate cyclase domain-containing protein [Candidatus Cloacimonadota bacterium]
KDAYYNLSELYDLQGKKLRSLEYFKNYAELADSIMSAETNRNIADLQTQHEVEKRELENRILKLDIQRQRLILASAAVAILLILTGLFFIIREKRRSEKLLLNILPRKVATDLKRFGSSPPQTFEGVSVLFSDFVDFTRISSIMSPEDLISELSQFFTEFDRAVEQFGCERIKTIGDAYLAVCGLPQAHSDHASRLLNVAKAMLETVQRHNSVSAVPWEIRIGLHCGSVVGGIVGTKKYIYDVFGDAINTASRMESNSVPMRINVSEEFFRQVADQESWEARTETEVKGKGSLKMYFWNPQTDACDS